MILEAVVLLMVMILLAASGDDRTYFDAFGFNAIGVSSVEENAFLGVQLVVLFVALLVVLLVPLLDLSLRVINLSRFYNYHKSRGYLLWQCFD